MWARLGRVLDDDGPMGRSLAFIVLVAAWVSTWRPQLDPDAWWHIATGDLIRSAAAIPGTEPFSWLTAGDRFVAHSWLWDVVIAEAFRIAGSIGTSLLVLPVNASIVVVLWALVGLVAPSFPPLWRSAAVALAVIASLPLWAPRSQTLDLLFVLTTVLVIARYLRLGSARWLWILPVIGILWANLHGSAILGLVATLAIGVIAAPVGERMAVWPHRPWPPLAIAGIASIAAACVNPYGPWLFAYPFDRSVASAFSPEIIEWRSPDFRVPDLWIARAILAGALIVIAWPRRKGDPFVTLVAAGWTFVALGSVRFLPIGSAMLVVALAAAIGPAVAGRLATTGDGAQSAGPPFGAAIPLLTAAVVSIIAVVVCWSFIAPSSQSAAIAHRMPVAAVEAFEAGECPGRILPAYDWAAFVNHATGRAVGAYGNSAEAPLVAQAAVELVTTDPRPWLDSHGVDVALMPATGPLSHWLDEASDWHVAYRDSQATIHVRAARDDCQVAAVGLRPSSWMNHWVRVALPRRVEAIQARIGTKKNG